MPESMSWLVSMRMASSWWCCEQVRFVDDHDGVRPRSSCSAASSVGGLGDQGGPV